MHAQRRVPVAYGTNFVDIDRVIGVGNRVIEVDTAVEPPVDRARPQEANERDISEGVAPPNARSIGASNVASTSEQENRSTASAPHSSPINRPVG